VKTSGEMVGGRGPWAEWKPFLYGAGYQGYRGSTTLQYL